VAPEVEDHDLAPVIGKFEGNAVKIGAFDLRRHLARFDPLRRRRRARRATQPIPPDAALQGHEKRQQATHRAHAKAASKPSADTRAGKIAVADEIVTRTFRNKKTEKGILPFSVFACRAGKILRFARLARFLGGVHDPGIGKINISKSFQKLAFVVRIDVGDGKLNLFLMNVDVDGVLVYPR
jgi:hypothetical protein